MDKIIDPEWVWVDPYWDLGEIDPYCIADFWTSPEGDLWIKKGSEIPLAFQQLQGTTLLPRLLSAGGWLLGPLFPAMVGLVIIINLLKKQEEKTTWV